MCGWWGAGQVAARPSTTPIGPLVGHLSMSSPGPPILYTGGGIGPQMDELQALLDGDPRLLRAVKEEVARRRLCDSCLGRQLGKVDHATNAERGELMRRTADPAASPLPPAECVLCEGLVEEYDALATEAGRALAAVEWASFMVGCRVNERIARMESELGKAIHTPWAEALKSEVNREVGRRVELATGGEVELATPDVTVLVDPEFNTVELQVRSVFVYGRYTKLVRDIPQTRWPCRRCRGRGCPDCQGTGKQYLTSVEEIIAAPFMEALGGAEHALHGAGREDIDARMLGRGRPFVVEIRAPKRREWDPIEMERRVNAAGADKAQVAGLRPSTKSEVVRLKGSTYEKTYRITFTVRGGIDLPRLEDASRQLTGAMIKQRTPSRVAHRRADLERLRRVARFSILEAFGDKATVEVRGESGIYVKELIHGDRGRTQPSLSGLLGTSCDVVELDVLEVHDSTPKGG